MDWKTNVNYGYFSNSNPTSQLAINIGSQNEPNFEVIDEVFGDLEQFHLTQF